MQQLVNNRYRLVWKLGDSGMTEVHLARDDVLGRDIALKVLSSRYSGDEEFVGRFRREARSAAALSHPNIVSIFDQGETGDGTYYVAMEYLPGGTLKERLKKLGPLPARRAAAVALQIARALRSAHDGGVIHGHLEPRDVLITESGDIKVKGFGILGATSSMTGTDSIPDRDHYLSPEQVAGEEPGPKSDLYSLGVILYEMLTGELPHDADTIKVTGLEHANGHLREPIGVDPSIPEGVNAVVMRLLARHPEDRYTDTDTLVEDLQRVGAGLEPAAGARKNSQAAPYEEGRPRRADRRQDRRRRGILLLAMALLALVVLSGLAWAASGLLQSPAQNSEPEPPPEPQPVMVEVPDLEGMALEEARQKAGDDLDVVQDGRENSSRPENTVLSQDPSGGQAERGSGIRVVVASGQNEVPPVEGRPFEEAQQALTDAGFEPTVTEAESTPDQAEFVLSQDPAAGGTAGVGSQVDIVVGTGPAPVAAPNLYGYTLDEAAAQLESLGLALGGNDTAPSDEIAEGGIIAQSVAPGASVEPGTIVGVTLSSGPETIPVPNVVGQRLSQARQSITNAGFYYNVLEIPNAQWPRGTVLYTDPGTGAPLVPGSTVTIGYSSGPSAPKPAATPANTRNANKAPQARNRPARSP
jgi:beta-lactam-binding protein with PASTA domain